MEKLKIKPDQMQEAARAIDYLYTHNKNYTKAQEEATTVLYYLFFKGLHPYKEEEPAQDPDAEKVKKAAARIYEIMEPWEACETTEEETAEEIRKNPLDALLYVLDILENYL